MNTDHSLPPLDFDVRSDDPMVIYIADHLPRAKTRKDRDAQILDNEHAIRRWMEAWS